MIQLLAAVVLFLAAFGGRELFPKLSEPVFQVVEQVLATDIDLQGLAMEAGAFLQGEGDKEAVFREVLGIPGEEASELPTDSAHQIAEVKWLNTKPDPSELLSHYLPRWEEQEKPLWLP